MENTLYSFQETILNTYLQHQDIALQAPTGGGKTLGAILPALEGLIINQETSSSPVYPQRLIYGVPMRVLARSFYNEHHKLAQTKSWQPHWKPTIQTGESPDDPLFEGRVIFATVDQILASFLNVPYGIPKKLDNINAGAILGSYLVFDEFHLYPRDEMMLTVLAMLKMLKGISQFMLMSATFSPVLLNALGDYLEAAVISDPPGTPIKDGIFHDVKAIQTRKRTFYAADGELTSDAVLNAIRRHDARRVLCICNTVEHTQALFDELKKRDDISVYLLHSRMYQQDRQAKEDYLIQTFKNAWADGKPEILIATQVIEVGIDISSAVMLTECAPASALIQRAGRCARRENEEGHVYVFQPLHDGEINYMPYTDDYENVCHKTWTSLYENFNGAVITFAEEQAWIDMAHGEHDTQLVDGLASKVNQRITEITQCMYARDTGYIGKLIRKNNAVPLLIHPDPQRDNELSQNPHRYEAISIRQSQIQRAFESLQADDTYEYLPFWFMGGKEIDDPDSESLTPNKVWKWRELKDGKEAYQYFRFVAHPQAVSYTSELGLRLNPSEIPARESTKIPKAPYERIDYHAERYHEHITGLIMAYNTHITLLRRDKERHFTGLDEEIAYSLARLCELTGRNFEQVERLLRLTLAVHDLGKLSKKWQSWSQDWQRYRQQEGFPTDLPADEPAPLAHTDALLSQDEERELQKNFKHTPRGNHAVESAMVAQSLIRQAAEGDKVLEGAVIAAIMHHHTPIANSCGAFEMIDGAGDTINLAMQSCGFNIENEDWLASLHTQFTADTPLLRQRATLISPTKDYKNTFLYFIFVRALRLADQRSGHFWQKYKEQVEVHSWDKPFCTLKKTRT